MLKDKIRNLTVLLPTYNSGEYLQYSIRSILKQTFRKFELLIIDDGSNDDTEKVINGFSDSRIRYVKKEHEGLATTLNYGLSIAKYDWVARMDADDICHPERLAKQISVVNKGENFISCTWAAFFRDNKILFTVETPINSEELKRRLALHCYINHPSVLYNKNFILSNGGYNSKLKVYEDYELWLRILNDVFFDVIPECLLFVRYVPDSLSKQKFSRHKEEILYTQNKYYPLTNKLKYIDDQERIGLLSWREWFYGDKNKARKYWIQNPSLLLKLKVTSAFLLSFLPVKYLVLIQKLNIKYRINYILKGRKLNRSLESFIITKSA